MDKDFSPECETVTVGDLREFIKDIPDNYILTVPIWAHKYAKVDSLYTDEDKKHLQIGADVA